MAVKGLGLALLLMGPLLLGAQWKYVCDSNQSYPVVGEREHFDFGCYDWDTNETLNSFSQGLRCKAPKCLACIDPHVEGTETVATAEIYRCLGNTVPATPGQQCVLMAASNGTTSLDGANEGDPATQTTCMRVPPGLYTIKVTAVPDSASETARVVLWAE